MTRLWPFFLKLVTICILFNIDTHRGCTGPSQSSDVIDKIRSGTTNKVTYKDYLDRVSDDEHVPSFIYFDYRNLICNKQKHSEHMCCNCLFSSILILWINKWMINKMNVGRFQKCLKYVS